MAVLWYGGSLVIKKELTPGTLTSFVLYTITVSFALGGLMELVGDFMKAIGASERVFQLVDRTPRIARASGTILNVSCCKVSCLELSLIFCFVLFC